MKRNSDNRTLFNKHNVQVLQALEKKYSRDYLLFFETLSDLYVGGPKKDLDVLVVKINNVITQIQDVTTNGFLGKDRANQLLENIQVIEEQKEYWIEQSTQNQALQDRISKVTQKTGINPRDLNVTLDVAKTGVQQAIKSKASVTRQSATPQGLGRQAAKALSTSFAGPFSIPMKGVWDLMSGLGSKVMGGLKSKKEQKQIEQLSPVSGGIQHPALDKLMQGQSAGFGSKFGLDPQVASLKTFFEKEAYRTAWTKELLDNIKQMSKATQERDRGGGLLGKIAGGIKTALFTAMGVSTVAGGLTMAALTIGTATVATLMAKKFIPEAGRSLEAVKGIAAAEEEAARLHQRAIDRGVKGISPQVTQPPGVVGKVLRGAGLLDQALKDVYAGKDHSYQSKATPEMETPKSHIDYDELNKIVSGAKSEMQNQNVMRQMAPPILPGMDTLSDLTAELKKFMQHIQNQATPVPMPTSGRSYDAGDTLLQRYAEGNLTIGE